MRRRTGYLTMAFFVVALAILASCSGTGSQAPASNSSQPTVSNPANPTAAPAPKAEAPKAEPPKYPTKGIEIVVPYAAGGAQDQLGRFLAAYAQEQWKVPVTVTNKAGGGGFIGAAAAFAAQPDGYTLLVNGPTTYYTLAVTKDPPIKITDGTPVARIVVNPLAFAVKADSKWNSLKDVVADLKKAPESYKAAASGTAGLTSFSTAPVWVGEGIDPSKIPVVVFDGGAPAHAAVAGGSCDYISNNISEAMSLYQAKKIKLLAVTTAERYKATPEVPTGKEAGFPAFSTLGMGGLWGPSKLPDHVVTAWSNLVQSFLKDPKVLDQLDKAGFLPGYQSPKDFSDYLMDTYNKSVDIGKILKLQL